MELKQKHLNLIPKEVDRPAYNREKLFPYIVHIGVGGFHRSHQAFYLDKLLNKGDTDWAICGMGIKQPDERVFKILKNQDFLYTLMEKHPDGKIRSRLIGSIIDFIFVPDYSAEAIKKLVDLDTKIVSLTITEGGYNFDQNGEFILDDDDIQWDIQHPKKPKTVFGLISAALKIRMEKNIPSFTILSCDNIQHNGNVTKKMLLAYTKEIDKELSAWIEKNVCFPNSMVDRITPVTTNSDIEKLFETTGIKDAWPIVCEPFIQWVVEDKFSYGRPPLEKAGVQFVSDVTPYEKMKIRLLNAGHSLLGLTGSLCGYNTIDETIKDKQLNSLLHDFMDREVTPVLGEIEGVNIDKYKQTLINRFANPNIKDSLSRICSESSAKIPKFIIPTIKEQLAKNGEIKRSVFVLAAWCRTLELLGTQKYNYKIKDAILKQLVEAAKISATDDKMAFIKIETVFGDLWKSKRFRNEYFQNINIIRNEGIKEAIQLLFKIF